MPTTTRLRQSVLMAICWSLQFVASSEARVASSLFFFACLKEELRCDVPTEQGVMTQLRGLLAVERRRESESSRRELRVGCEQ